MVGFFFLIQIGKSITEIYESHSISQVNTPINYFNLISFTKTKENFIIFIN